MKVKFTIGRCPRCNHSTSNVTVEGDQVTATCDNEACTHLRIIDSTEEEDLLSNSSYRDYLDRNRE